MRSGSSLALVLTVVSTSCGQGADGVSTAGYSVTASGDASADSETGTAADAGSSTNIAETFTKVVLRTDQTNPDLVNPWGLAFNETAGPAWIADNGTGKASVFDARNNLLLTVTTPVPKGSDKAAPTGLVFNRRTDAFKGDTFVFVTEDGTIVGFQQSNGATLRVDNSARGAVYKGATISDVGGSPRLIAANFSAGRIEVFDQNYQRAQLKNGAFVDSSLPSGFAPFNADAVGGIVLVTYAKQDEDKHDDVSGPGNGFVDAFDVEGNLLSRLASNGPLNSPWGLAVTPDEFGRISHRLLVGNFGDGHVNVYAVELRDTGLRASFEGQLGDTQNRPLVIDGLWALRFPRGPGFNPRELYFTAGPDDESHGAYGRLDLGEP